MPLTGYGLGTNAKLTPFITSKTGTPCPPLQGAGTESIQLLINHTKAVRNQAGYPGHLEGRGKKKPFGCSFKNRGKRAVCVCDASADGQKVPPILPGPQLQLPTCDWIVKWISEPQHTPITRLGVRILSVLYLHGTHGHSCPYTPPQG